MSKEKAAELLNKIEFNIGIRHSEQIGDYSKFEAKVYKMLEDPTQTDICCKRLAHILNGLLLDRNIPVSYKRLATVIDKPKYWLHLCLDK